MIKEMVAKLIDVINKCDNLTELQQIKVAILGKKGIFKELERLLWQ